MAPVVRALARHSDRVETRVALTGQHTELVDQVLEAFQLTDSLAYDLDIAPYDLDVMKAGQSLYDVVQGAFAKLPGVLRDFRPHAVLVEGDTATVLVASLAAFFERMKVGHVEAGLRSHDKWAPFPEEIFRRVADVVADWHFAPTPRAAAHLLEEGVAPSSVHVTGNTVVDALLAAAALDRPVQDAALRAAIEDDAPLVLLTAHRRESFGEPLREIFAAVRELADRMGDVRVVYPVHRNPEVAEPARELLTGHPRIALTEPLDYFDMVAAMRRASLVLTDSGGVQEEAPTFGAPVLVLRRVTERPEGIEAGVAELVGTDGPLIVERAVAALAAAARPTHPQPNPYGDGRAGERIADIVVSDLCGVPRQTEDWSP